VNGCDNVSFGDHGVLEGDRIPPLKSHGQALEEELCFPGVLSDIVIIIIIIIHGPTGTKALLAATDKGPQSL